MPVAPYDLNASASHVEILKAGGVAVKGTEPESTTCPACKKPGLGIWRDYLSSGQAYWMHCKACNWSGDSIETYAHFNRLGVEEAIQQALRLGCLTLPPEELNPAKVSGYLSGYVDNRRRNDQIWDFLEANLNPVYESFRARIVDLLWAGDNPSCAGFEGTLGAGLRIEISKKFGKEILPRKGFGVALAVRYQDVPGRTCGILFRGEKLDHYHPFPEPSTNSTEGGLTRLDSLAPHEEIVYVLDDPYAATILLNTYMLGRAKEIKVVACQENTRTSWHAVNADKVFYRASAVTGKLFNHMKLIRNVYLTTYPELDLRQFAKRVRAEPPNALLLKIQENSKPGYRFFADWLISDRRREDELAEFRATAQLDAADRGALLDACLAADRKRLEWCLGSQPAAKTIIQRGRLITERSGVWYVRHKNELEEPITDATPVVEQTYGDADTGKRYEAGYILFKGRQITFKDPRDLIEKNPKEWVESTCVKSGIGSPFVSKQWGNDLLEIAVKMHPPKYISSLKRLGYDASTKDILLPRFTMIKGKFIEDRNFIGGTGTPADNILIPTDEKNVWHKLVDEVHPKLASLLAGMAAVTANILAPLKGWSARQIYVVSSTQGVAAKPIKELAALVDAPVLETYNMSPQEVIDYRKRIYAQRWPHAVIMTGEHLCGLNNIDNLIINASALEMLSLRASGIKCATVTATSTMDEPVVPNTNDWLLWLADLQRREYELLHQAELPLALLWDFSTWWAARYNRIADRLYMAAKNRLEFTTDAGNALLDLYLTLYSRGALDIERKAFYQELKATGSVKPKHRAGIVVDEAEGVVMLVRSKLLDAQNKLKLPVLDALAAEAGLNSSNFLCANPHAIDGWLVTRAALSQAESRVILTKKR